MRAAYISKLSEWNKLDNISLSNFRSNRQPEERERERGREKDRGRERQREGERGIDSPSFYSTAVSNSPPLICVQFHHFLKAARPHSHDDDGHW